MTVNASYIRFISRCDVMMNHDLNANEILRKMMRMLNHIFMIRSFIKSVSFFFTQPLSAIIYATFHLSILQLFRS